MAFACFEYATLRTSQNALAWALLLLVTASLPPGCTPLFVLDRGDARVALLAQLRQAGIPDLVRGRRHTMVRLGAQRLLLGRVPHRPGVAVRYAQVASQHTKRELVDLIVFHDPTCKEPWSLLVPPDSAARVPTDLVVALYRQRRHIELTFRDWKTHLGIRGLRLAVDIAPRLERLLLALTVASTLAVLLGAGPAAQRVREDCELLRTTPRPRPRDPPPPECPHGRHPLAVARPLRGARGPGPHPAARRARPWPPGRPARGLPPVADSVGPMLLAISSAVSPRGPCGASAVPSTTAPALCRPTIAPSIRSLRRPSHGSRSPDSPCNGTHSSHLSSHVPPRQPGSSKNWGAASSR